MDLLLSAEQLKKSQKIGNGFRRCGDEKQKKDVNWPTWAGLDYCAIGFIVSIIRNIYWNPIECPKYRQPICRPVIDGDLKLFIKKSNQMFASSVHRRSCIDGWFMRF